MSKYIEDSSIPEPNTGCWLWIKALNWGGYGQASHHGKNTSAHRLAYTKYKGPIPKGLHVLHRCDVRCCVNPEHLFLGTNLDNMRDRDKKGRGSPPPIYRGKKKIYPTDPSENG